MPSLAFFFSHQLLQTFSITVDTFYKEIHDGNAYTDRPENNVCQNIRLHSIILHIYELFKSAAMKILKNAKEKKRWHIYKIDIF